MGKTIVIIVVKQLSGSEVDMRLHADFGVTENCINIYSYGEICVCCGCCENEPNVRQRYINRLNYYNEILNDELHFNLWFDDEETRKFQERNVQRNINYHKKMIRRTKKILRTMRGRYGKLYQYQKRNN